MQDPHPSPELHQQTCSTSNVKTAGATGEFRASAVFATAAERNLAGSAWPVDLFEDPARQPRFFEDPVAFIECLLTEDFVHEVILLRDGCRKLGLTLPQCFEPELRECFEEAFGVGVGAGAGAEATRAPIFDFLKALEKRGLLDKYRARVQFMSSREGAGASPSASPSSSPSPSPSPAVALSAAASANSPDSSAVSPSLPARSPASSGVSVADLSATPNAKSAVVQDASPAEWEDSDCDSDFSVPPPGPGGTKPGAPGAAATPTTTAAKNGAAKVVIQEELSSCKDLRWQLEKCVKREMEERLSLTSASAASTATKRSRSERRRPLRERLYLTEFRCAETHRHPLVPMRHARAAKTKTSPKSTPSTGGENKSQKDSDADADEKNGARARAEPDPETVKTGLAQYQAAYASATDDTEKSEAEIGVDCYQAMAYSLEDTSK